MEYSPDLFSDAQIARDRELFLRELLSELALVLEETVGLEDAQGFISIVGNRIGELMNEEYRAIADADDDPLTLSQVAAALVDLKRRIKGGFSVESIDENRIVLVNTACPFGQYVRDRQPLCMMTSNVFGRIAAANLGYARVDLAQTIAAGADGCRVIVHLTEGPEGREYFG